MELSIFVMYCPDRLEQLEQMVRLNSRMTGWSDADKVLLVDGDPNVHPDDFRVVTVPRVNDQFCWASMWEAGVTQCDYDNILYLDSDRVLPVDYLEKANARLTDNTFVFSDSLFGMHRHAPDDEITSLVDTSPEEIRTGFDAINDGEIKISYDPRYRLPLHGPGKGPMSGNVMFTRAGYERSGGVDPWFCGHGAYADTDFHKQVWEAGYEIAALEETEIHLYHPKLSDSGSGVLEMRDIEILSLNNFIYHAKKWALGYHYPKAIASYLKLEPDFVDRVLERIEAG